MKIGPYINFPGNCREAVAFYKKVFKAEEPQIMTYGALTDKFGIGWQISAE